MPECHSQVSSEPTLPLADRPAKGPSKLRSDRVFGREESERRCPILSEHSARRSRWSMRYKSERTSVVFKKPILPARGFAGISLDKVRSNPQEHSTLARNGGTPASCLCNEPARLLHSRIHCLLRTKKRPPPKGGQRTRVYLRAQFASCGTSQTHQSGSQQTQSRRFWDYSGRRRHRPFLEDNPAARMNCHITASSAATDNCPKYRGV